MASHHHHHLCHQPPLPTPTCYCQTFYAPYTPCHHHPPPPDPQLHYPHHPQQPQDTHPHPPPPPSHPHFEERYFQEEKQTRQTISSLIRRIAALESALLRRSSSLPQSLRDAAARTIQTHFRAFLLRRSRTLRQLKELSSIKLTLTILKSSVSGKTHFDYNLVYHKAAVLLRKLDTIQGGDPMIRDGKSSIKREVNKFLIFIDGICLERSQLSSRVNVRYERNNVKSRVTGSERERGTTDNVKCGSLDRVKDDKLKGLLKKIDLLEEELEKEESDATEHRPNIRKHIVSRNMSVGSAKLNGPTRPNVKKSVSFADDGKLYKLVRRNQETSSDEDWDDALVKDNLVDARELEDDLCPEVEEIGVSSKEPEDDDEEEAHSEDEDSQASSVGEKDLRSYPISEGNIVRIKHNQGESETFVFSAPLPVKMETRGDLTETRKK